MVAGASIFCEIEFHPAVVVVAEEHHRFSDNSSDRPLILVRQVVQEPRWNRDKDHLFTNTQLGIFTHGSVRFYRGYASAAGHALVSGAASIRIGLAGHVEESLRRMRH